MRTGLIFCVSAVTLLSACTVGPKPFGKNEIYNGVETESTSSIQIAAPDQCFEPEAQTGAPSAFHRESIIDQPVLVQRKSMKVPSAPIANRNFYCAAFHYSVDEKGRVKDILTLYDSHPGLGGINFAKAAEQTLKDWRYQPGLVDKAPAKYTGLKTVFYYAFDGAETVGMIR